MVNIEKDNIKKQILDAFMFRNACKEFDPTKTISNEDFNFILETARLSPSSFGFEPWEFLVLQNKSIREKIKPFCSGAQLQLPTASHFVIILARADMQYDSDYVMRIMKEVEHLPEEIVKMKYDFFKNFEENDYKLFESERAMTDWAKKQVYIPLANMMTSAAMIKIDSCPIEGFVPDKIQEILAQEGLIDPNKLKVACMVAFGYRAAEPMFPKTRQSLDDIVKWVK